MLVGGEPLENYSIYVYSIRENTWISIDPVDKEDMERTYDSDMVEVGTNIIATLNFVPPEPSFTQFKTWNFKGEQLFKIQLKSFIYCSGICTTIVLGGSFCFFKDSCIIVATTIVLRLPCSTTAAKLSMNSMSILAVK